jgi:flagellar hook-associated protein 3 FlgL
MAIGRVTESSIHTRVLQNLQRSIAKGQKIQDQLSSGKTINRPSDSPTGAVTAMQLRGETRAAQQYGRNADDGLGWLNTLQSTLDSSSTLINQARDLTVQGLSGGSNDAQSNSALAAQIDQIKASLLGYANTKYLNRPVFGGSTAGDVAYDENGVFVGNTTQTTRTVGAGDGAKVRVDASGPEAFGPDGGDVFKLLQNISDNLKSGNSTDLNDNLGQLDAAANLMRTTLSGVGARYNRVEQMQQSAQDRLLSVTAQLSDVEDVDLPKTIMDMQLQQTAYQAALAASAKVIQPSLIDYLR